ncbi:hypothetical protein BDZ91DRAFT_708923 [Kalaharituber pfeilii]|nr:hypothetical protein BDZ91DRAFT_708923 [Kalaharituber pfeilii]
METGISIPPVETLVIQTAKQKKRKHSAGDGTKREPSADECEKKKHRKDKRKQENRKSNERARKQSESVDNTGPLAADPEPLNANVDSDTTTKSVSNNVSSPSIQNPSSKPILKPPLENMGESTLPLQSTEINSIALSSNSLSSIPLKANKPKKSVKFTPETTATDGDSRDRIHKALIAAYKAPATVTPEELANSIDSAPPPAKRQKEDKKKKQKKRKDQQLKVAKDEHAKEAALKYLQEFYRSRQTWKFQKAKQNWILRNLFDVELIEAVEENGAALKDYIAGLQSQDARGRLLEEAKKIIADGNTKKKDDDEDTFDEGEVASADKEKRSRRVERAHLVMIALGHEDDEEEDGGVSIGEGVGDIQIAAKSSNGNTTKASSDSDDSNDDDDDEEEEEEEEEGEEQEEEDSDDFDDE